MQMYLHSWNQRRYSTTNELASSNSVLALKIVSYIIGLTTFKTFSCIIFSNVIFVADAAARARCFAVSRHETLSSNAGFSSTLRTYGRYKTTTVPLYYMSILSKAINR